MTGLKAMFWVLLVILYAKSGEALPIAKPETFATEQGCREAAAHTPGGYGGVPQSVGKEFAAADDGHTTSGLDRAMQKHADKHHPVRRGR